MREIKFRAWDKEKTAWFPFDQLEMLAIFNLHDSHFKNPMNRATPNLVFMQFTGVHDKNGKEIYEGDIIRIFLRRHIMEYSVFANAKICFEGAAFWFDAPKIGFTDCNWHFYNQADREVIGNIYENPELINNSN